MKKFKVSVDGKYLQDGFDSFSDAMEWVKVFVGEESSVRILPYIKSEMPARGSESTAVSGC